MNMRKDIDVLRAEEIAKLFLLQSKLGLVVERSRDQSADFVVKISSSQARIAIEVKDNKNLKRELKKMDQFISNQSAVNDGQLPTILIAVDKDDIAGDLALLSNWDALGELKVNREASFIPYSRESLEQLIMEVVRRFEESHALAS